MTTLAVCPLGSFPPPRVERRLLALSSLLVTDQSAARRLGRRYIGALGTTAAAALVREQEQRLLQEVPHMSRSSIAALISADFRSGRTIDVDGLHLSRLESAVLMAGCADQLPTPDFA